jgi:hypothetical protein
MHLALGDQRERAWAELDRLAVDQVAAVPVTDPDQLVVRVPVRLAHVAVADAALVELEGLEGIRLGGQIVDCWLDHHPTLKRIRQ